MTSQNLRQLDITCAFVLFLASLAFPRPFLHADSHGLMAVAGGIAPENLQVASMTNPVGVDGEAPSLSWELRATVPGTHDLRQTSYRILVASSADELAQNRGSLWDSGRVQSNQRLYVAYGGRPLSSYQSCYWKVRIWDQALVVKPSGSCHSRRKPRLMLAVDRPRSSRRRVQVPQGLASSSAHVGPLQGLREQFRQPR